MKTLNRGEKQLLANDWAQAEWILKFFKKTVFHPSRMENVEYHPCNQPTDRSPNTSIKTIWHIGFGREMDLFQDSDSFRYVNLLTDSLIIHRHFPPSGSYNSISTAETTTKDVQPDELLSIATTECFRCLTYDVMVLIHTLSNLWG